MVANADPRDTLEVLLMKAPKKPKPVLSIRIVPLDKMPIPKPKDSNK